MNDINLSDVITHHGVIRRIDFSTRTVRVAIDDSHDKCPACPAAAICSAGKGSDLIDIRVSDPAVFHVGQKVIAAASERMHRRAVALLTFLPCAALIASITGVYLCTANEALAVAAGLAMTFVFFIILFVCRHRIARQYSFTIISAE